MGLKIIKRPLKLLIGWVMLIVGIITAPIPIPIGQVIALIGLSILVSESHWVKTKMHASLYAQVLEKSNRRYRPCSPSRIIQFGKF
jgi:hypothetical protein